MDVSAVDNCVSQQVEREPLLGLYVRYPNKRFGVGISQSL